MTKWMSFISCILFFILSCSHHGARFRELASIDQLDAKEILHDVNNPSDFYEELNSEDVPGMLKLLQAFLIKMKGVLEEDLSVASEKSNKVMKRKAIKRLKNFDFIVMIKFQKIAFSDPSKRQILDFYNNIAKDLNSWSPISTWQKVKHKTRKVIDRVSFYKSHLWYKFFAHKDTEYRYGHSLSDTVTLCGRTAIVSRKLESILKMKCSEFTKYDLLLIKKLHLFDFDVLKLRSNDFKGLSNLEELHISPSKLTKLPAKIFFPLKKLKKLKVWFSGVSKFHKNSFKYNSELEEVDFSSSKLKRLHPGLFKNSTMLKHVDLAENKLKALPKGIFSNNKKLETLNLSFNQFRKLDANIFSFSGSLKDLYIAGNKFTKFPVVLSSLVNLEGFNAAENNISSIDGAFKNLKKLKFLRLENNNIKEVFTEDFGALAQLEGLFLSSNAIEKLPNDFFNVFHDLQYVGLGNNKFTSFDMKSLPETIWSINLSNNDLESISEDSFYHLKKLGSVNLSFNPRLVITNAHLKFPNKILFLELSGIKKLEWDKNFFQYFDNLWTLEAANSNVTELYPKMFQDLTWLSNVNLAQNKISHIPLGLFANQGYLGNVNLSSNQLSSLPEDIFKNNDRLSHLNLSHNFLKNLPSDFFQNLKKLNSVDLTNNKLEELSSEAFDHMTSLWFLMVSKNPFLSKTGGKKWGEKLSQGKTSVHR